MDLICRYASPLGPMTLAAREEALMGVWFDGQRHDRLGLAPEARPGDSPVLGQTAQWLDAYFQGRDPGPLPPLAPRGSPFQLRVWALLGQIPYGETVTYGALAARLGLPAGAARAVGGAVGRNPISLLIPCHRVVGAGGNLTGYAGGLDRKRFLLALEAANHT